MEWIKRTCLVTALLAPMLFAGCGLNIPKPDLEGVTQEPELQLEESEIEIPVTVHLGPILQKAEEAVPREFASDGWESAGSSPVGDVGVKYRLWRDPLLVTVTENRLTISVHAYYWLAVAHRLKSGLLAGGTYPWMQVGQCGEQTEAPREIIFTLETTLGWNERWNVVSSTKILPNLYPNSCNITALNFDITAAVDADIRKRLEEAAKLIDERMPQQAAIERAAEATWKRVQEPLRLDRGVWLLPNATGIHVTPIFGGGDSLTTAIGITARPVLLTGKKPLVEPRPLPPLKLAAKGSGRFNIALRAELGFETAAEQLMKRFAEKPMTFGKRKIQVTGVTIYPSKKQCVIQLSLTGDVRGKIYLMGEPVYDETTGSLYFNKLNYSLETQNVLHAAAEWLLHDDFREALRKNARWVMGTELTDAKAEIEKALNMNLDEHTTLKADVQELKVERFYMTPKAFKAAVVARGRAAVEWK